MCHLHVEGCWHFVFGYKMLAEMDDSRLVVEFLLDNHAQNDLAPHPGPLSLGLGDTSSSNTKTLCSLINRAHTRGSLVASTPGRPRCIAVSYAGYIYVYIYI